MHSEADNDKLKILSHEMTYGTYGTLSITGVAENVAGKTLSYVQVDVKFYDEDGVLIGNSLDNANDLEAGEKWKFEAVYFDLDSYDVDSYKIGVGSVW